MSSQTLAYAAKVTGIGSAHPQRRLTNVEFCAELAHRGLETSTPEWIEERTGIRERRISAPGNPAEHNSSLGYRASIQALEMAGKRAEDIDQILYATCSPDTPIPSTACWLQSKLGAKNAWSVDLNAACSGFLYALSTADQFIRTGHAKTILVVGAEVLSSMTNWDDRNTAILFGDGAGAVVVEAVPSESKSRILSSHMLSDGDLWELLYVPAGGSAQPMNPELCQLKADRMRMKGREIFKIAVRTLTDFAVQALEKNGLTVRDLDWFIPHQANLRIIEAVAKKLDFPMEKVIVNIERYGNTSAATVPTALDEAVRSGRVRRGDLVLMDVFGAGLTYGSLLLRW